MAETEEGMLFLKVADDLFDEVPVSGHHPRIHENGTSYGGIVSHFRHGTVNGLVGTGKEIAGETNGIAVMCVKFLNVGGKNLEAVACHQNLP